MGLSINYIFVDKALAKIKDIFGDIPKDKQENLTDDVLDFLKEMEKKYSIVKDKKVYLIDLIDYEFDSSPLTWDDEKFKAESKIQGNVYSLDSFVKQWNCENIIFESFMRII